MVGREDRRSEGTDVEDLNSDSAKQNANIKKQKKTGNNLNILFRNRVKYQKKKLIFS